MGSGIKSIENKLKGLTNFQRESENIVINLVGKHDHEIVKLLTEHQLFNKGVDSNDKKIRPSYSPYTIKYKLSQGQPVDRVTWRDSGDLHKSIYIVLGKKEFTLKTDNAVLKYLEKHYKNKEVLGLTTESKGATSEIIKDDLIKEAKNMIL